ncbi:MAG: hypothetical protein ACOYB9_07770 [Luoshenia tenuis]|jgi:hypothetical protein
MKMQCPICRAQNPDSYYFCPNCGCMLKPRTGRLQDAPPVQIQAQESPVQGSVTEPAGPAAGAVHAQTPQTHAQKPDKAIAADPLRDPARASHGMPAGAEPIVTIPEDPFQDLPETRQERAARKRSVRRGMAIAVAAVAVVAAGIAGYAGVNHYLGANDAPVNRQQVAASPAPVDPSEYQPKIEAISRDGEKLQVVTVRGQDGESVRLSPVERTAVIQNGSAQFEIKESELLNQWPESEQVSCEITVTVEGSGQPRSYTLTPEGLKVEPTELVLISPEGESVSTTSPAVLLDLQLEPGSKLWINGEDVSTQLDDTGRYTVTVPLTAGQTSEHTIKAQSPYHLPITRTITIERPGMPVTLSLSEDLSEITEEETFTVSGQCDPDAVITCPLMLSGSLTQDSGGNFTFTAQLRDYGWQNIEVTATMGDGSQSRLTHRLYRKPNAEEYTKSAWKMDYPKLSTSPEKLAGKVFLCEGTIGEVTPGSPMRFTFTLSDGEALAITYDGAVKIKEGDACRIFADVVGEKLDGLPLMAARLIYPA